MDSDQFLQRIHANPANTALLERLPHVGLPDVWLVSGGLFQTVWNTLTDRPPAFGIRDYDIFYYDPDDLSWEAEDRAIRQASQALADLDLPIEIRNQARVHLWYPKKFGKPYPPLASGCDGIHQFLATVCMVGVQPVGDGPPRVFAPAGFDDLFNLIVRPNLTANFNVANYKEKADRWKHDWPELTILDPELP